MTMKHIVFPIITGLMILAIAPTGSAVDGQALLKVEHGARWAGMGATGASLTFGPDGSAYNPASAAGANSFALSMGHTEYWEGIKLESGYFSTNFWGSTSIIGGIRYAAIENIEGRTEVPSDDYWEFGAYDFTLKLGLARWITPRVAAGFAVGTAFEKIGGRRGGALSFDLGTIVKASDAITLGASAVNLGPDLEVAEPGSVGSRPIPQPTTYRVGGSYKYQKFLGAVDLVNLDEKSHMHFGAERKMHRLFLMRAGFMTGYDTKNFTAGVSFVKRDVAIHYAFVPYKRSLGNSHMFNLALGL